MRYMGYPLELENAMTVGPMDPTLKAQMLAQMPGLSDEKGHDMLDLADATNYGKRQRWIRIGGGAAAGLVLGLLLASLRR
jgi:ElaB/YqjD/DUF883 family membrane-anchored ribosome-binding protein